MPGVPPLVPSCASAGCSYCSRRCRIACPCRMGVHIQRRMSGCVSRRSNTAPIPPLDRKCSASRARPLRMPWRRTTCRSIETLSLRLVQHSLEAVVFHCAVRLCAGNGADFAEQLRTLALRKEGAGQSAGRRCAGACWLRHRLPIEKWNHQVVSPLPNIPYLQGRGWVQLMLDRQVPLIVDRRLNVRIPKVENRAFEARKVCATAARRRGRNAVRGRRTRQCYAVVVGVQLRRGKGRVLG